MPGVAMGQLTAFTLGAIFLAWYLASGRSRLKLNFAAFTFQRDMFFDILKVGAVSCLSPLQTVLTDPDLHQDPGGFRHRDAGRLRHGLAAGIPADADRLCVWRGLGADGRHGDGRGSGDARAQVAWTAAHASSLIVGMIGIIVAIRPALWVSLFTSDPGVTAAANSYFALAGPAFAFFGMGACLYFSSQGAAKVGGPVLAGTARLLLVGVGGWWLASSGAPAWTLFALVGVAMAVYGLGTALAIRVTRWGK